jgi:hypothetical protein
MNKSTVKSTFLAISMMISLTCFLYVNIGSQEVAPTVNPDNKELVQPKTNMPDLKIMKGIVDIFSKFLTAK